MPHLKGKEIPMYVSGEDGEARTKVGTALVVHHDVGVVEFYVRLEDPTFVGELRRAPVAGLFFEISRPYSVGIEGTVAKPLEYPIHVVDD